MKKKIKGFSVVLCLFILIISFFILSSKEIKASTDVSGIISTDTTWSLSGSPYNISSGNLQIASGITLNIEPGVTVNGYGNKIELWGNINAIGNLNSNVILNNVIIEVENNAQSGRVNIQFARIDSGTPYKGEQQDGKLTLRDSRIYNASRVDLWYPKEDCYIERNIFFNSEDMYTGVGAGGGIGTIHIKNNSFYFQKNYAISNYADYGPGVIVEKNSFMTITKTALILLPTYGEAKITATNNYWNTTDNNIINSMIYDKNDDLNSADYIIYTPFLSESDGDTPLLSNEEIQSLTVATPTASPAGGTYTSNQSIILSTTTSGATIHYTTDGSTPTVSSPTYSSTLTVSSNITLKAIAVKSGMADSAVMSESYTINIPQTVAAPTASPAGGNYTSNQSVTLSTVTSRATIYYTTDGSTPTSSSATYSSPLSISNTTTLKAIAIKSGMIDSGVMIESYNVQVKTDTPALTYSISKKAKKRISYTFTNLSLTNKKYVTMRIGGRKVKVVGLRRSGSDSIVTVELKYAKWGRGNYSLFMSYKNQTKTPYKDKKGRTKYRKGWERGSVTQDDILTIS